MDKISKDKRSKNMSKIRSKNTKPELFARKTLWKMGYRYRIHFKSLPGSPDIVLTKLKTAIFVHGCFWHRHEGCSDASRPKTNTEYWENKITRNIMRDKKHQNQLKDLGWKTIIIWACELSPDIEKNVNLMEKLLYE